MNIGMLWFDNDPKTALNEKARHAAEYFQNKYGKAPNLCIVHPSMLPEEQQTNETVKIRPWHAITPGHLWIGVEETMPIGAN